MRTRVWLLCTTVLCCCSGDDDQPAPPRPGVETVWQARRTKADAVLREQLAAFEHGDGAALWASLPPTWAEDIDSIVRTFTDKTDPQLYERAMTALRRAVTQLEQRRDAFAQNHNEDELRAYQATLTCLSAWTTSRLATHSALRRFQGDRFLAAAGGRLLQNLAAALRTAGHDVPDPETVQVQTVQMSPRRSTLTLLVGGEARRDETFLQVEDRWVPESIATAWTTQVRELQQTLAALPAGGSDEWNAAFAARIDALDELVAALDTLESFADLQQFAAGLLQVFIGGE